MRAARLLLVMLLSRSAWAQQQSGPASPTDFDFLEGEWTIVYNNKAPGFPPNIPGSWIASRQADGRILYDEFRVFGPQGKTAALGATYRVFDFERAAWDMRYVGVVAMTPDLTVRRPAQWAELTAWREGETIRVDQRSKARQLRITYYDISPTRFSWKADVSTDGGKTWRENQITIEATRKAR